MSPRSVAFLSALVGAAATSFVACGEIVTKPDDAIAAAKAYGIEGPKVTARHGVSPHLIGGCTDKDDAAYDIEGTRNGEAVKVVVCCGWPRPLCRVKGAKADP